MNIGLLFTFMKTNSIRKNDTKKYGDNTTVPIVICWLKMYKYFLRKFPFHNFAMKIVMNKLYEAMKNAKIR